jgi:hypothetical protein
MGPSRGVRAGGSARAASRRHRAVSHEVSLRSGDTNSDEPGRVSVPARPARRFDALRVVVLRAVRLAEAKRRPPMRLRASPETCPCSPAPQRRVTGRSRQPACPAMLPLLGFRALRHSPGPADPHMRRRIPPPPRAPCEVWVPPSRRPPPILPARKAPERPWASPLKAFPSCASGAPLGVRALLTLPAVAPNLPGGRDGRGVAAFRVFYPRRVRAVARQLTRSVEPSMPSRASPLQSVRPIRPGHRL